MALSTPYKPILPSWLLDLLAMLHVDWQPPRRQPRAVQVVLATIVSIVGSLVADAALVKIGTTVFPSTHGYVHFRLSDYAKLTVIGVVIACAAWPITTRITSTPRWLFWRMAIAVTMVLLVPDVWLVLRHNPVRAVAVLMCMHIAIAVVTYCALVVMAPTSRRRRETTGAPPRRDDQLTGRVVRIH